MHPDELRKHAVRTVAEVDPAVPVTVGDNHCGRGHVGFDIPDMWRAWIRRSEAGRHRQAPRGDFAMAEENKALRKKMAELRRAG